MDKVRVVLWAAAMRKRMGVDRILKEPSTLELDIDEEEVADEVKRSGISPLDYYSPSAEKPPVEEDKIEDNVDDISDDFTENLTNDNPTNIEDVNDDSEMSIDVVNIDSKAIETPQNETEAPKQRRANETRSSKPDKNLNIFGTTYDKFIIQSLR